MTETRVDPRCPKCGSTAIKYSRAKLYNGCTSQCACGHEFDQQHAYDTATPEFWAGSMDSSFPRRFDSARDRDQFVAANNGFTLEASQIDPDLRP